MKKISFTLVVIALVVILPLCVMLEMNHITGRLTETDPYPVENRKTGAVVLHSILPGEGNNTNDPVNLLADHPISILLFLN